MQITWTHFHRSRKIILISKSVINTLELAVSCPSRVTFKQERQQNAIVAVSWLLLQCAAIF